MDRTRPCLEICCQSAQDALLAQEGGADRIELNADLDHGGLTPSVGALRAAKRLSGLPVYCMLRPRPGGFCYSAAERLTMREDARALLDAGADGLVFGLLDEKGRPEEEGCARLLEEAAGKPCVFHRALDLCPDREGALEALVRLGFCRVLTSGGARTAPEGAAGLRRLAQLAAGRIQVLPGGGIRPENLMALLDAAGLDAVHASAHGTWQDRSLPESPVRFNAAHCPPDGSYLQVRVEKVRALREALDRWAERER